MDYTKSVGPQLIVSNTTLAVELQQPQCLDETVDNLYQTDSLNVSLVCLTNYNICVFLTPQCLDYLATIYKFEKFSLLCQSFFPEEVNELDSIETIFQIL